MKKVLVATALMIGLVVGCAPVSTNTAPAILTTLAIEERTARPTVTPGLTSDHSRFHSPVEAAISDLGSRLGIPPESIRVVALSSREWRDDSLGCPKPNVTNAQVITPGYRILLQARRPDIRVSDGQSQPGRAVWIDGPRTARRFGYEHVIGCTAGAQASPIIDAACEPGRSRRRTRVHHVWNIDRPGREGMLIPS